MVIRVHVYTFTCRIHIAYNIKVALMAVRGSVNNLFILLGPLQYLPVIQVYGDVAGTGHMSDKQVSRDCNDFWVALYTGKELHNDF